MTRAAELQAPRQCEFLGTVSLIFHPRCQVEDLATPYLRGGSCASRRWRVTPDAHLPWMRRRGSLRAMNALTDINPKDLRPLLHAEIDKLRDEHLELAHRLLQEIELQQVMDDLDDAADEARAAGRLTPERIAEAIAAHRVAHPYR